MTDLGRLAWLEAGQIYLKESITEYHKSEEALSVSQLMLCLFNCSQDLLLLKYILRKAPSYSSRLNASLTANPSSSFQSQSCPIPIDP